jgi:hypothetical protein
MMEVSVVKRWIPLVIASLFLLSMEQVVLAQTATGAAPTATHLGTGILLAALNGAVIGVLGWLSQRKTEDGTHEAFDPVQLVTTVVVGAGIGAVAAWRGKSFGDVETWIQNSGYVTLAEVALKALWRNGTVTVQGVLTSLQQGAATNPTPPAPPAQTPKP